MKVPFIVTFMYVLQPILVYILTGLFMKMAWKEDN